MTYKNAGNTTLRVLVGEREVAVDPGSTIETAIRLPASQGWVEEVIKPSEKTPADEPPRAKRKDRA